MDNKEEKALEKAKEVLEAAKKHEQSSETLKKVAEENLKKIDNLMEEIKEEKGKHKTLT